MTTLERIVALKEKFYKTDAEFERAAGISPKMFDKWKERGSMSYRKHIVGIARALGTTSAYLLCETDDPTKKEPTQNESAPVLSPARAEVQAILDGLPDEAFEKLKTIVLASIDAVK